MLNDVGDSSQYISTSQYAVKAAQNLSFSDEQLLLQESEAAIIYFLENGLPVYIHAVGILFPKVIQTSRPRLYPSHFTVSTDKVRIFDFEKCSELIALQKERFKGVVETRDIAIRVYKVVAKFLSSEVTLEAIFAFIHGLFKQCREEIVLDGQSTLFPRIGHFFALHNRQGETQKDWFAGADIFLKSIYEQTLLTTKTLSFERPTLCHSLEPFEALYGPPICIDTMDMQQCLPAVGYNLSDEDLHGIQAVIFRVAVFADPNSKNLIYVSDGLRSVGIKHSSRTGKGQEFVIQIPYSVAEHFGQNEIKKISVQDVPLWPKTFFTLAWILLQSSKTGNCKQGVTIAFDDSVASSIGINHLLSSIMVTRYERITIEQLVPEGAFEYANIIALTKDEERAAKSLGIKVLLSLLKHRKYDQSIPIFRQSVTKVSSFSAPLVS